MKTYMEIFTDLGTTVGQRIGATPFSPRDGGGARRDNLRRD